VNDDRSKSLKTQWEEACLIVAQNLPAIARTFADKATSEKDASVAHAKFLVDTFHPQPAAAKNVKAASEEPEEKDDDSGGPSLTQVLIDSLREMLVDEESKPPVP